MMSELQTMATMPQQEMDWLSLAESLGKEFAARDIEADETDLFVADNIAKLRANGLISAGVPIELGGGGASHADLCAVLRILGSHCSSTALAPMMSYFLRCLCRMPPLLCGEHQASGIQFSTPS
jgi:alkylation response protein AidB-like acyl-CoA dehydrogenase